MTIRTRLTFWYAGVMFVCLTTMGAWSYREFVTEPRDRTSEGQMSAAELADQTHDFRKITGIVIWSGVPALLLALAGGWWLARTSLAPVSALTKAVEQIHERNLNSALARSGNGDELDRLTEVFNAMTARLDDSFQRIREFTLHASHELKTPLTILHSELETELSRNNLPPEQREKIAGQLDEIQRLSKIVDGLTLLTKADAGQIALPFETVALDEIVRDAYEDAQTLAKSAGITVELADCEQIAVRGNRHRLRQLLLNLADNAVKYNQPQGRIGFSLRRVNARAQFTITNTGAGISPDKLPRVFDRFYRGDASHNSAVDGCGLGLSIAQWIVAAHRGTIQIESTPGKRTTVTVTLPME